MVDVVGEVDVVTGEVEDVAPLDVAPAGFDAEPDAGEAA